MRNMSAVQGILQPTEVVPCPQLKTYTHSHVTYYGDKYTSEKTFNVCLGVSNVFPPLTYLTKSTQVYLFNYFAIHIVLGWAPTRPYNLSVGLALTFRAFNRLLASVYVCVQWRTRTHKSRPSS